MTDLVRYDAMCHAIQAAYEAERHDWSSHSSDALRHVAVAMQAARRASYREYDGPPTERRSVHERGSLGWLRG